ncbi:hypothetical protein [Clostridium sp.]|uniref:hypothetical protein n=1 Tax=Clostridium sp. TaxID=1506 RepID=UPI003F2DC65A
MCNSFFSLLEDRLEKEHNETKSKLSRIDKIKLLFDDTILTLDKMLEEYMHKENKEMK